MTPTSPWSATENVERSEHAATVLRFRRLSRVAILSWISFGAVDWFITAFVHPGSLGFYLTCRAVGLAVLIPVALAMNFRAPQSPRLLTFLETSTAFTLCALITLTSREFGGITSPLIIGVITVVVGRGLFVSDHYRRAVGPALVLASSYPLTLGAMALYFDDIGAQFNDPVSVATFVLYVIFLGGIVILTLAGGHVGWALRRKVFETRSLGRYRLESRIGRGGMGEVWRAHDRALGRDVAVKVLNPSKEGLDEQCITRFEREVRATSELSHPNTVRVYDIGQTDDGLFYYAMELLEGQNLGTLSRKTGPMPPSRAVHFIWQASRALAEAHKRGLVHRDLKPANLFVTTLGGEEDFIKVLDFGLVARAAEDDGPALTQTGFVVGSAGYIPPEVVNGNDCDPRGDVYALGTVLFRLLCGRMPFDHHDVASALIAAVNETPPTCSERLGRPVPAAIERVVMRCIEKNPERRYRDAGQLSRALEYALRDPHAADNDFDVDVMTTVDDHPPRFPG